MGASKWRSKSATMFPANNASRWRNRPVVTFPANNARSNVPTPTLVRSAKLKTLMELQPPIRFQLTTDNKRIPSASNYIQASFQLSAIEQQSLYLYKLLFQLPILLFNFHIALPYAA